MIKYKKVLEVSVTWNAQLKTGQIVVNKFRKHYILQTSFRGHNTHEHIKSSQEILLFNFIHPSLFKPISLWSLFSLNTY